jgi:hypothetical protein
MRLHPVMTTTPNHRTFVRSAIHLPREPGIDGEALLALKHLSLFDELEVSEGSLSFSQAIQGKEVRDGFHPGPQLVDRRVFVSPPGSLRGGPLEDLDASSIVHRPQEDHRTVTGESVLAEQGNMGLEQFLQLRLFARMWAIRANDSDFVHRAALILVMGIEEVRRSLTNDGGPSS